MDDGEVVLQEAVRFWVYTNKAHVIEASTHIGPDSDRKRPSEMRDGPPA